MGIDDDTAFDELCDIVESYGKEKCLDLGYSSTVRVFKALDMTENADFSMFIILCISADGFLTKEEYYYARPLLSIIMERREVEFEEAKSYIERTMRGENSKSIKQLNLKNMRKLTSEVAKNVKEDIVMSGLYACACDGRICESERLLLLDYFRKL